VFGHGRCREGAIHPLPRKDTPMVDPENYSCLEACQACQVACLQCAAACLEEEDPGTMKDCIKLDLDCAAVCALAAEAMARDSDFVLAVCALCADICDACADECEQYDMEHCEACAEACRRCADACREMVGDVEEED
jgi:hypothetical protein